VTKYDVATRPVFVPPTVLIDEGANESLESALVESDRAVDEWPLLPWPRGPLSGAVIAALQRPAGTLGATPPITDADPLSDDDFALAHYLCYEAHFRGLADPAWGRDAGLLALRTEMERAFEERLRHEIGHALSGYSFGAVPDLDELIRMSSKPSLSIYLSEYSTIEQFREFCIHCSTRQLKETEVGAFLDEDFFREIDVFATMPPKADDTFDNSPRRASLFGSTMTALGLNAAYGSYVENLPGVTLATLNLASMFSQHQRWSTALVGHHAVSAMTTLEAMGRCNEALTRLGVGPEGRRFYETYATLDTRDECIARDRLVAVLTNAASHLGTDLLFGASAVLLMEQRFAVHVLDAWSQRQSSLVPWELSAR
jgi:hypothetical protein